MFGPSLFWSHPLISPVIKVLRKEGKDSRCDCSHNDGHLKAPSLVNDRWFYLIPLREPQTQRKINAAGYMKSWFHLDRAFGMLQAQCTVASKHKHSEKFLSFGFCFASFHFCWHLLIGSFDGYEISLVRNKLYMPTITRMFWKRIKQKKKEMFLKKWKFLKVKKFENWSSLSFLPVMIRLTLFSMKASMIAWHILWGESHGGSMNKEDGSHKTLKEWGHKCTILLPLKFPFS